MTVSRRRFVSAAIGAGVTAPALLSCSAISSTREGDSQFHHGVASGDPLQDRVIIWTRVTSSADSAEVFWEFSKDEKFDQLVASGQLLTDASRDYTVKIDVTGLQSDSKYFYRFRCDGQISVTGRTRTLPSGSPESFNMAVVSCSNYPEGYFNVYRIIAERDDIDLVLHLGDYIYEYANGEYGDGTEQGRVPMPNKEITTLQDYRQRYACYREDEDLAAVHARHPFVLIWDDHEFADNAWLKGARNHNSDEGSWNDRRNAATQVYFEWMPIREIVSDRQQRIYRSFQVGDLFDLIMLDTRIIGRDLQFYKEEEFEAPEGSEKAKPQMERNLLGVQQQHWLAGELAASKQNQTLWRVLGQQVMMAVALNAEGEPLATDIWDGYPASRQRLLSQLKEEQINNNIVLTGDIHTSWASDIAENPFDSENYNSGTGSGALAVEFVTPSVSSPPGVSPREKAEESSKALVDAHPHIKYVDLHMRGYMVLEINRQYAVNSWYHIESVALRSNSQYLAKRYRVDLNRPGLHEVEV